MLLAGLPLLAVVAALLLRQSAFRASLAGVGSAIVIGAIWFALTPAAALSAAGRWWPLVLEVMLIVMGGIAFAEVGRRVGAQERISAWLRSALGTGIAPVLAIVHGITPLAESLTGFGIGAALAVPLLVSLGLDGKRAAVLGLLGLCAVPWGSMAPGTLVAAELGGVGFYELGVASALASLPVFVGVGIAAALMAAPSGQRFTAVLAAVGSGGVLWVALLGANLVFGTAPAGAVGAAIALATHLFISRIRGRRLVLSAALRHSLVAYVVLLGGVLLCSIVVRITGTGESSWRYIASPALWLFVATLVAARGASSALRSGTASALRTWLHVGPATALFVILGVLMSVSGMSEQLASELARLGGGYLFAVPFIGAAGGFITGSNVGANAMFAAPQSATITTLGAELLPAMAVQNVTASLLMMASPARVELAARLCPDPPPRTAVQGRLLTVDLAVVVLLGATLMLL